MTKHIFLFVLFLLANLVAAREPIVLDSFFNQEEQLKIDQGRILSRMFVKYNSRQENSHANVEIPRTEYVNEDLSVYEIRIDEKSFLPYALNAERKLEFYNLLTSFSRLEGMEYYSRRAGQIKKLVEECYRVESLSGTRHADIKRDQIKAKVSHMFRQKDNKLGTLFYRSDLYNEGDHFILVNTCVEPITKLMFNINDSEEYKIISYFIYSPEKQGYYCYSVLAMRINLDFLLKSKKIGPTAYSNRLRASTVHLAKLIGLDWRDKLNAWPGQYDTY